MSNRRQFIQSTLALSAATSAGLSPLLANDKKLTKAKKSLNILFLGGTGFLGPHTVQYAIDRGHNVTLFNRGRSKENLFPNLEALVGNRDPDKDAGLAALAGRSWDCVIDTSAYVPRIADASAKLLAKSCKQYLFVSTISVYKEYSKVGITENDPVGTLEDTKVEKVDGMTYGPLKAYCEQAVRTHFKDNSTIIRPGLIVGPRDKTDRYTYWPVRVARGGDVLAPGDGSDKVQYIDVRDLAEFMIHSLENNNYGTYNAISDSKQETVKDMLASCQKASKSDAKFIWADTEFLTQQQVRPWADMPVWVPNQGEMAGMSQVDVSKALSAGLSVRDRELTAFDTLKWFSEQPEERRAKLRAGLSSEREVEVIQAWKEKKKSATS